MSCPIQGKPKLRTKSPLSLCILLTVLLLPACTSLAPATPALTPTHTPTFTQTSIPTQTPISTETPLPTATPEGEIGSTWVRPQDGMLMVFVPKGTFIMGSESGESDEQPAHEVYLDAFWIDQTEITYTMYARFDPSKYSSQPVQNVTWQQAQAYCAWAGSRLPSEAEWEKAARGTDERTYPWGDQPPAADLVNFADLRTRLSWADVSVDDGYSEVAPVGEYPAGASPYGALDMAGNAAEWVNDWYAENYYAFSPQANPPGPEDGMFRVLRGGSYYTTAAGVRTTERSWYLDETSTDYIGFRCARSSIAAQPTPPAQ
jgi:formylglycine-generating enzyme required for sulfatase activity